MKYLKIENKSCATYIECQDYFDDNKHQEIITQLENKINELVKESNRKIGKKQKNSPQ